MTPDRPQADAWNMSLGLSQLGLNEERGGGLAKPRLREMHFKEPAATLRQSDGREADCSSTSTKRPPLTFTSNFSYAKLHKDVTSALSNLECKICGDKASGYHYGAHTCEGCKGFFRRTVQLKLNYRYCGLNCRVHRRSRNKCQFCRFRKCLMVGMSHSAIRFGRTPLAEREKMISEFRVLMGESEPDSVKHQILARQLYDSYLKHFPMTKSKAKAILTGKDGNTEPFVVHDMASLTKAQQIVKCKQPTVAALNVSTEVELSFFRRVQYSSAESMSRLTEFAKSIPGFVKLDLSDQITMLKYSAFEVHILRLGHLTNKDGALMAEGQIFMTREFIKSMRRPFCDMMESKIEFLAKFNALQLEDCDLALFFATVILCGDRPGLVNAKAIEKLQDEVLQALDLQLKVLHPTSPQLFAKVLQKITDLRPLALEHVRIMQLLEKSELEACLHPLIQEIMKDLY